MTFRSFLKDLEDQRARGPERPHGDFFVEWQIPDDDLVDLSVEASETEVVLAEEKPVSGPR